MSHPLCDTDVAQFSSDKIINKAHFRRVCDWVAGGENVPPITMELDMTNMCNHHCPGCPGGRDNPASLENPRYVLQQLAQFGVKGVTFTGGGEPLIDGRTPDMLRYAKELGLDVALITNGSIMTPDIADAIVDSCVWCRVSLDASNTEEYAYSHGMPERHFGRVVDNIALLANEKSVRASDCTVGVGYLTNDVLLSGMVDATKLCKNLGVDYIQFRPWHGSSTKIWNELEESIALADDVFSVLWSRHKYCSMCTDRTYTKCYGQQFASVIGADGSMYVCCHMRGIANMSFGNVNVQSVEDIWNSDKRRHVVDAIDVSRCMPLCRCNTFNEILWNIMASKSHVNFL